MYPGDIVVTTTTTRDNIFRTTRELSRYCCGRGLVWGLVRGSRKTEAESTEIVRFVLVSLLNEKNSPVTLENKRGGKKERDLTGKTFF